MIAVKNIYRSFYILIGIIGILIQLGIFANHFYYWAFNYYTILSNILCIAYFGIRIVYDNTKTDYPAISQNFLMAPLTKYCITMCILLTFLVYHFLLDPLWNHYAGTITLDTIGNYIVHYIIPLLTLIDFLLFDRTKSPLKWYAPLVWMVIPFSYFIYILIRAPFFGNIGDSSSPYPYPFIDFTIQSVSDVLINIGVLIVIFIIIGYILLLVDYLIKRIIRKI